MSSVLTRMPSSTPLLIEQDFADSLKHLVELSKSRSSDVSIDILETNDPLGHFPCDFLYSFVNVGLSLSSKDAAFAFDTLLGKVVREYLDFGFYVLRALRKSLSSEKDADTEKSSRIFEILLAMSIHIPPTGVDRLKILCHNVDPASTKAKLTQRFSAELSSTWLQALERLPVSKVKKCLYHLEAHIIPRISKPELLVSFLNRILSQGSLNSILAMDAIFFLIRSYNIEFEAFYDRLFGLLSVESMTSSYNSKLMASIEIFMSSTMIPAYIVAGIVKKMVRISLSCPTPVTIWIITFVYNMLLKYPSCRVLINQRKDEESDMFNPAANDLKSCNALQSSLWELASQKYHYWPKVAKLIDAFEAGFQRPPFDLKSLADSLESVNHVAESQQELSHQWSRRPTVQIDMPLELF